MEMKAILAPLWNWRFLASVAAGLFIGLLMPLAFRIWIRAMQAAPSGWLATVGLLTGIIGALVIFGIFVRDLIRESKLQRTNPERPVWSVSLWHFPLHMFCFYLLALPAGVCLHLQRQDSLTAADWAKYEDRFVAAAEGFIFNGVKSDSETGSSGTN